MSGPGIVDFGLAGLAAVAAGTVNALAGGGTLITFPTLTALGLPAVAANITNTIALCPGYVGGALAQRGDLAGQGRRLGWTIPAALCGGTVGGLLLLHTEERLFRALVPYLILLASLLLAVQGRVRVWLAGRSPHGHGPAADRWAALPVAAAAVYGGYFGAGLSVIVLAALGVILDESITRLNAVKQLIGLAANAAAAVLFLFSGQVEWTYAGVMALGALAGGALGGRLAGRVRPGTLRWIVVTTGVVVGLIYLL